MTPDEHNAAGPARGERREHGQQTHVAAADERLAQQHRWSDAALDREPVLGTRVLRRLAWATLAALTVVLLVTLPPLLNINRYQHRVASSIAGSLGRAVRFDNITLHMLPLPGFTIDNFVVYEDPAFGAEPAMRANRVIARIRVGSLWRRRIEVSRIRLESPTVNLVRNAAGFWNMQGVVTEAAQVRSAPTAQPKPGSAPRFPYIEGTDARINVKLGDTKTPYALVDTEFALWLPTEQEWHLRLAGRPLRSDTDASDVGLLRAEATLSRQGGNTAHAPFTLHAVWKPTPMGEAGKLLLGRDTGWRGQASAEATLQGTPASMHIVSDLHLHDLRRAEFAPPDTLQLDAHCEADSLGLLHQISALHCALPTATGSSLLDVLPFTRSPITLTGTATAIAPDVLRLDAAIPNTMDPRTGTVTVELPGASPLWALRWMRLFSRRMSPATDVGGTFSLRLQHTPLAPGDSTTGTGNEQRGGIPSHIGTGNDGTGDSTSWIGDSTSWIGDSTSWIEGSTGWTGSIVCQCTLPFSFEKQPAQPGPAGPHHWLLTADSSPAGSSASSPTGIAPTVGIRLSASLQTPHPDLSAAPMQGPAHPNAKLDPAGSATGQLDAHGLQLQYSTAQLARNFATILPALGDNLPPDATGPLTASHTWGTDQTWTSSLPPPAPTIKHRGKYQKKHGKV